MNSRKAFAAGFTLIELLVSAALTAVIGAVIVAVMSGATATWARTAGKASAAAQARVVLDQLAIDLQSSLYRDDGKVWLAADVLDHPDTSGFWTHSPRQKPAGVSGHSLVLTTDTVAEARFGQAGVWLRFFSFARGSDEGSSALPVAVAYQVVRYGASGDEDTARYILHRSQARAAEVEGRPGTIDSGCDLDPLRSDSNYARSTSVNDGTREDDPFSIQSPRHLSARWVDDVIDFGVRLYRRDATGALVLLFPTEGAASSYTAGRGAEEATENRFPVVIDAMVRVLTDEGARSIALLEAGRLGARPPQHRTEAEWWWSIAEAHSHVFVRRIVVPTQR